MPFSGATRPTKHSASPRRRSNGESVRVRPLWITVQGTSGCVDAWLSLIATRPRRRIPQRLGRKGQVEPAVEGRDDRDRGHAREHQVGPLEVRVDDVELGRAVEDRPHRREHVGHRLADVSLGAERALHGRDQAARDIRVAARERRDLVATAVELGHQLEDDPLGATVREGRDTLERRSDVGDAKRAVHRKRYLCERKARSHGLLGAHGTLGTTEVASMATTSPCSSIASTHRESGLTEQDTAQGQSTRSVRAALGRASLEVPGWGRLRVGSEQPCGCRLGDRHPGPHAQGRRQHAGSAAKRASSSCSRAVVVAAWVGGFAGGLSATIVSGDREPASCSSARAQRRSSSPPLDFTRLGAVRARRDPSSRCSIASAGTSRDRHGRVAWPRSPRWPTTSSARDERLELVLAASGTGFWEWDIRTGELVWSEAIFRQHGLRPGGRGADLRALPGDHPPRRPCRVPGLDRRGPRPGHVVQPRVPPGLAGRLGPLDPWRRAGLPRTPRASRSAWSAPARTSPSDGRLEDERDRLLRGRAPRRHVPRGVRRHHLARTADPDHDDLRPDPDPGPAGPPDHPRGAGRADRATSPPRPSACTGSSRTCWC